MSWWRCWRRGRDVERALDAELRDHLHRLTADYQARGLNQHEALRAARLAFGGVDQTKEICRDVRGLSLLRDFGHDMRYACRLFARARVFACVAVLTLALGVGSTAAVFSILEAVLLRPLPYRDVDRLVAIWAGHVREKGPSKIFARYDDYETWRRNSLSFEELAAATWATGDRVLTGPGPARLVLAIPASVNFFSVLGAAPYLGRTFDAPDLTRGCVVVLSHRFWRNAFGGERQVVGQSLALDDRSCVVVGVMPEGFAFYPDAADMWTLITANREPLGAGAGVGVFGRLKAGITREQAQAELTALNQDAHARDPEGVVFVPRVYPLQEEFTWLAGRNLRLTLLILFGAVNLVLLIACLNVASLLVGRSLARQPEFAVRAALGSGRWRVVRQVLTEGFLLSAVGTALGVLIAVFIVRLFRAIGPVELPPGVLVRVDPFVLAFAAALSTATALGCGLLPAWKASQIDISSMLKAAARQVSRHGRRRSVGQALVIIEVAGAAVLLVAASLLTESVVRLGATPLGFRTEGVVTASVKLAGAAYATPASREAFYLRLIDALRSTPGTIGAALGTTLIRGRGTNYLTVEGRPAPSSQASVPDVGQDSVGADYFHILEVPLRRGRWFTDADREASPGVAIVNDALVRKYFADLDPLGQRIKYGIAADAPWLTIVGVVGNQKTTTVYQEMGWVESPVVFRPILQVTPAEATLFVRTDADPQSIGPALQSLIGRLDPDVPLAGTQTLRQQIAKSLAYPQFRAQVLGAFAALAFLLSVIGLYAVLSQLVGQRTQEIGLRLALGAQPVQMLRLVLGEGLALAGAGLFLGLAGAAAVARVLAGVLFGLTPFDASTFLFVSMAFIAVAALASSVPARRAMRVDPVISLRTD